MRLTKALLAALAAALAACSPGAAGGKDAVAASPGSPAVHPVSGLPVIPLTVTHDGKSHRFRVEVARTAAEQARGLMFRTAMGPDEGMIFPMKPPRLANFWMHNTVIPLDIIFIGTDGRIMNIAADAVPYSDKPLPSDGLAKAVLEINGGRAAQLGIGPGDKVRW
jgi:uncharacterized membrane protein (UPF0127 family)